MRAMPSVMLPSGETVPAFGQGTWTMGANARRRKDEVAVLKLGFDLGLTVVDTAEMYADGGAEEVVGEAMAGRRDEIFVVSKVLPSNASRRGVVSACERSLKRLKTDRIDLYLLHWPGSIPIAETVAGFGALIEAGKIRYWGVSNFDVDEMEQLLAVPGGAAVAANQVMYNLKRRGIEYALLPWLTKRRIAVMAYSPLDQGHLLGARELQRIAARHGATPAQVALAWLLRQKNVIVIPKAGKEAHLRDNHGALKLKLHAEDLEALDRAFPPPARKKPLETT